LLCSAFTTPVASAVQKPVTQPDVFASNVVEIFVCGETEYTLSYYYNADKDRVVEIVDNTSKTSDVLLYNTEESLFYLNDELIGSVAETSNQLDDVLRGSAVRGSYVYYDNINQKITWLMA